MSVVGTFAITAAGVSIRTLLVRQSGDGPHGAAAQEE
ncbi:hypothetical protein JOD65_001543 [Nocardioides cavernae]|nr:hypothetical protein [Nocardioides cavernae]